MNVEVLAWNVGAHWLQSGALALSALTALRVLHVIEPRAKLAALHLTLVAILMLPLLQPWRPYDSSPPAAAAVTAVDAPAVLPETTVVQVAGTQPAFDPAFAFGVAIAAGVAVRLLWILYGMMQLRRLNRRAAEAAPPMAAAALEAEIGVSARYILQAADRGPWTFGLFRPTVALPSRFEALAPDFQRAVICHELVHIERRDIPVAHVEEVIVALLWFHPWVWLVRARIRVAREQAVDARVVALLGDRDGYVRCLVNLSGHDLAPHFSQAGAGMLRPRELRARVDAIFEGVRMSRRHLVFAALALMLTVGATTYVAGATVPMRSASIADAAPSILEPRALIQAPGGVTPRKLELAISSPIQIQFKEARLRDVLAFIGYATSVVFTGYEPSFDAARSITIDTTTIDTAASLEAVLDTLLTPSGLIYTVTGPRTVAIARRPTAELREAAPPQTAPDAARRQINKVYPEYPQDALERGIQGTVMVDIVVNAAGDVSTAAVASGPQELRASAFKAALALKYAPASSTTAMKVAFRYTLTGSSWGVTIGDVWANTGTTKFFTTRTERASSDVGADTNPDSTGAYRIGNGLMAPKKVKDAPPIYPPIAQQARVQGVVIMEARIDENGNVSDVRTLRSIPLLDQAAIDAVKQWQYTPTLLNGIAVPVRMTVTVNFTLRPLVEFQLVAPDGTSLTSALLAGNLVTVAPAPGIRFELRMMPSRETDDLAVSVFTDEGQIHLGDVVLQLKGPTVQLPTNPPYGMQFLGVR